jgi:CIC family chloride channel protein
MTTDLAVAYPRESLEEALRTMALRNVGRLPVVVSGEPTRMLGLLRRSDVINAFRQQVAPLKTQGTTLDIGAWGGTRFIEIVLAPDAPAANLPVRELAGSLPRDTVIVAVRRSHTGEVLLPRGDTVLRPSDVVIVLTRPELDEQARRLFESPVHATT